MDESQFVATKTARPSLDGWFLRRLPQIIIFFLDVDGNGAIEVESQAFE